VFDWRSETSSENGDGDGEIEPEADERLFLGRGQPDTNTTKENYTCMEAPPFFATVENGFLPFFSRSPFLLPFPFLSPFSFLLFIFSFHIYIGRGVQLINLPKCPSEGQNGNFNGHSFSYLV
jgi:hypothetical protein